MTEPTKTIDITPPGLQTPAGIKRVTEAQRAWEDSTAALANAAALFLLRHGAELNALVKKGELAIDLAELRSLTIERNRKQDVFLLALTAR